MGWRNSVPLRYGVTIRQNNQKGLQSYMNALKLGNLTTIPEIYKAADIKFDFSRAYIKELMGFVKEEYARI
jgi:oligoendopeptidase F